MNTPKNSHKYILVNSRVRENAKACIDAMPEGYEAVIQPVKKSKTLEQVSYTFGAIYPCILQFIEDSTGDVFTKEELHDYLKRQVLGPQHREIMGDVIEVVPQLAKKDRSAWSDYIDRLIKFAYSRWGINIPPPEYRGIER